MPLSFLISKEPYAVKTCWQRVTRSGGPHDRPQNQRDSRWARTDVGSRSGRTRCIGRC